MTDEELIERYAVDRGISLPCVGRIVRAMRRSPRARTAIKRRLLARPSLTATKRLFAGRLRTAEQKRVFWKLCRHGVTPLDAFDEARK